MAWLEKEECNELFEKVDYLLENFESTLNDNQLAFLSEMYQRYEKDIHMELKNGMGFSERQISWLEILVRNNLGEYE
jgi:hypothetical protein